MCSAGLHMASHKDDARVSQRSVRWCLQGPKFPLSSMRRYIHCDRNCHCISGFCSVARAPFCIRPSRAFNNLSAASATFARRSQLHQNSTQDSRLRLTHRHQVHVEYRLPSFRPTFRDHVSDAIHTFHINCPALEKSLNRERHLRPIKHRPQGGRSAICTGKEGTIHAPSYVLNQRRNTSAYPVLQLIAIWNLPRIKAGCGIERRRLDCHPLSRPLHFPALTSTSAALVPDDPSCTSSSS